MTLSKVVRLIVVYAGLISVVGVFYRAPFLLRAINLGEMTVVQGVCTLIACISLLIGALRFLLAAAARGWPFVLALLAGIAVLIGLPVSFLSGWFVVMVATCFAGALVGFWPRAQQPRLLK
jgi:hypothetical protein